MNAREWLASSSAPVWDVALIGAPISRASISPSSAHLTPAAFREGLVRFSTYDGDHGVDLTDLVVRDLGDAEGDAVDGVEAAHARIEAACRAAAPDGVVVVIGGDNSLTFPAMVGCAGGALDAGWGLLTFDAHHDVRDPALYGGSRNGTPVRDLITAGLPGNRVVQIGLQGFANAREHHEWAVAHGVQVRRASQVRAGGITSVLDSAIGALERSGAERFYVDFDLDVLDRSYAPACPASMPGGLTPVDLEEAAYMLGADPRVLAVDLAEVDAAADVAGITVHTMCAVFLSFCAGMSHRRRLQSEALA
ncbi:MAG TPA: arginase family protein [Candidatus Angelobacter sp.]|nr:arginase family protein [Candidatus Angelobacter sp.]